MFLLLFYLIELIDNDNLSIQLNRGGSSVGVGGLGVSSFPLSGILN